MISALVHCEIARALLIHQETEWVLCLMTEEMAFLTTEPTYYVESVDNSEVLVYSATATEGEELHNELSPDCWSLSSMLLMLLVTPQKDHRVDSRKSRDVAFFWQAGTTRMLELKGDVDWMKQPCHDSYFWKVIVLSPPVLHQHAYSGILPDDH
jgi:hypothetical protein